MGNKGGLISQSSEGGEVTPAFRMLREGKLIGQEQYTSFATVFDALSRMGIAKKNLEKGSKRPRI